MTKAILFGSRRRRIDVFSAIGNLQRRWRIHARIEAIAAGFRDPCCNPFLFQIESG